MRLTKEGRILKESHSELQYQLESVFELFTDLNGALEELEKNLDELEKSPEAGAAVAYDENADREREDAYRMAVHLDSQTKRIEDEIKQVVKTLNSRTNVKSATSTSKTMLHMLNRHQASMESIDFETAELERGVAELKKTFQQTQDSVMAPPKRFL